MNDLYEKAKARLAALREEEIALNQFILAHEKALRVLGEPRGGGARVPSLFDDAPVPSRAASPEPLAATPGASSLAAEPRAPRVTDNPKPTVVVRHALAILRESGHPMSRRDLHKALSERGVVVKGADPVKALGTMLWRAPDELIQLDGFGYWPKADSYPPASYVGEAEF